jgi:cyclophilin family peptidyl-prolyl cis-trans isomerase
MSRLDSDPNGAGSQFFILLDAYEGLDGEYTAFGNVIEGMSTVEAIAEQPGNPIGVEGGVKPDDDQHVIACWLEQRPSS